MDVSCCQGLSVWIYITPKVSSTLICRETLRLSTLLRCIKDILDHTHTYIYMLWKINTLVILQNNSSIGLISPQCFSFSIWTKPSSRWNDVIAYQCASRWLTIYRHRAISKQNGGFNGKQILYKFASSIANHSGLLNVFICLQYTDMYWRHS